MLSLVWRIAQALGIAALVYIASIFVGGLIALIGIPPAAFVGGFLVQWAAALAVVAFLLALAGGGFSLPKLRD